MSVCLTVCLICVSVSLSDCLSDLCVCLSVCLSVQLSYKSNCSLLDELILIQHYAVAVYDQTMCMKDILCKKTIKGDNHLCRNGYPFGFDSQF